MKWLCKCECGREIVIDGQCIKRGTARKECKECSYARRRSKRPPIIRSGVGVGFFQNGEEFIFSPEDFDIVEKYSWCNNNYGYAHSTISRYGVMKKLMLHRVIMERMLGGDIPDDMEVDHINRNRSDNRRENLRICTHKENLSNRKSYGWSRNRTGMRGVYLKKNGKWRARIWICRKCINLGTFDTYDEARQAREEAERKFKGETHGE